MPGSDFPGPVGTTIFVECSLRADDIRDALDRAEQAFLNDGYRVEHISRCIGYDLDDWDYDDCGGWSHNPDNSWDEMALFVLENGQLDEFPMVHCIDYDAAMNAFIELARTGNRSADIQWFPPVA